MADFITKNQLESTGKQDKRSTDFAIDYISDRVVMTFNKNKKEEFETSVFLSHSHKDKEFVEYLFVVLRSLNIKVYVDWLDNELTFPPSGKTADKIKKMIKENRKFILLATNDAIVSKWCNWELGFGDAEKYIDNIALLPVSENSGDWQGNEYLQIYPYVDKDYKFLSLDKGFTVVYPGGKKIDFEKWLRS
jgi:hypothetical protein